MQICANSLSADAISPLFTYVTGTGVGEALTDLLHKHNDAAKGQRPRFRQNLANVPPRRQLLRHVDELGKLAYDADSGDVGVGKDAGNAGLFQEALPG